jgi:hypothetical protein
MAIRSMIRAAAVTGILITGAGVSFGQQAQPGGGGGGKAAGSGKPAAPAPRASEGPKDANPPAATPPAKSNPTPPAAPAPAPTPNRAPPVPPPPPPGSGNTPPPGQNLPPGQSAEDLRKSTGNDVSQPQPKNRLMKDLIDRSNAQRPIVVLPYGYRGISPWWYGDGGYGYWRYDDDRGYYGSGYYGDDGYSNPGPGNQGTTGVNNANYPPPAPIPTGPSAGPVQDQARAINQLEGMPEFRQLTAELGRAQAAYDAAAARVLDKLKKSQEYQDLVRQKDHAEDRVEAVQAGATIPNPDAVTPAAQRKLNLSAQITKMEQQAIAADPQASTAKRAVQEINDRLTALRKQAQAAGAQSR